MAERKKDNIFKDFHYSKVLRVSAKTLSKDRLLINLLPKLKFKGTAPVTVGALTDFNDVYDAVLNSENFIDFNQNPVLIKEWLKDNVMDVLSRGNRDKEKFVSLKPFTLNAYKASNRANKVDYGISDQVYTLLRAADAGEENPDYKIINKLLKFLTHGYEALEDKVHIGKDMELLEAVVASIVNDIKKDHPDEDRAASQTEEAICIGQAKLLKEDLSNILAYELVMPKGAILKAVVQLMFLHTGIYVLKVAKVLPDMVDNNGFLKCCEQCQQNSCPYEIKFQLDFAPAFSSEIAKLSQRSVEYHERLFIRYIEKQYYLRNMADFLGDFEIINKDNYKLKDVFVELNEKEKLSRDAYFIARINEYMRVTEEEVSFSYEENALEKFISIINEKYNGFYFNFLKRLISSLFSKNEADALLYQTGQYKKYGLGNELLDTLINVASVYTVNGEKRSRMLRVDEFIDWLKNRYGFYISKSMYDVNDIAVFHGLRRNEQLFREKLQNIGYYSPTSDAYYTQWIVPRYELKVGDQNE